MGYGQAAVLWLSWLTSVQGVHDDPKSKGNAYCVTGSRDGLLDKIIETQFSLTQESFIGKQENFELDPCSWKPTKRFCHKFVRLMLFTYRSQLIFCASE